MSFWTWLWTQTAIVFTMTRGSLRGCKARSSGLEACGSHAFLRVTVDKYLMCTGDHAFMYSMPT